MKQSRRNPNPAIGPPTATTLAPSPAPSLSTSDAGVHELVGVEDGLQDSGTATKTSRANWNQQKKVYLIQLLKDHDVPRYRTQNAWSKEAWNNIVSLFNQKFSSSYTIFQVKQRGQDMKKEYRAVKELSGESGFGWDSDRKMVTASDRVWVSLEARRNKDALLRWRDKSFPYFDDLFALYDGRYASGKNCHGMDHYAKKAKQPAAASFSPMLDVPDSQHESPEPTLPAPAASSLNFEVGEACSGDYTNWFGTDAFSPVSNLGNDSTFLDSEGAHGLHSSNQVLPQLSQSPCFNSQPSDSTSQVAGTTLSCIQPHGLLRFHG